MHYLTISNTKRANWHDKVQFMALFFAIIGFVELLSPWFVTRGKEFNVSIAKYKNFSSSK